MDLNRIRERLESLSSQGKGASKRLWKPQPGSQVVRIVPYIHNRDWPFLELYFYYDFGKKTIIAPQNFGQPDPVQELADKLKSTGEREDWLLARKIEPKMRTYVPILIRGQEHEGVKFWGFGKTVYEELLKTMDDPDYGDITDLKTGSDITVEYEKGKDGFPKTSFRVKRNQTPATGDPEVLKLLKEMPTVEEIWDIPSYEELSNLLDKFINNADTDEAEDDVDTDESTTSNIDDLPDDFYPEKTATVKSPANNSTVAKGKVTPKADPIKQANADIDAAFDELFA